MPLACEQVGTGTRPRAGTKGLCDAQPSLDGIG